MFKEKFDVNKLSENGYFKSSIDIAYADMLLLEAKAQKFQEDTPDEPDYVGYVEKYYKDRYISALDRHNQENRSPFKSFIADSIIKYQNPLIRHYTGGSLVENTNVTVYEGKPGYMMDWHQDIGDRSISETIFYLNEHPWLPEHGGEIEISEVKRDSEGRVAERNIVDKIPPRHGDFVILENLSPHFEHRVLPWNAPHSRFSVIVIAGILHSY